ncbi:hypothetical protein Bca101_068583 [Brassica carinata]
MLHPPHHPHEVLIKSLLLHWNDRWRWWNLKDSWGRRITLNLDRGALLHINLWPMLHLNLRTTRQLMCLTLLSLSLLSCSQLPGNLLCSYSSSLLGSLLNYSLSSLLHHLHDSSLIDPWNHWRWDHLRWGWWNHLRWRRWWHMLTSTLSSSTGGRVTNNSPTRRHLKGITQELISDELNTNDLKTMPNRKVLSIFIFKIPKFQNFKIVKTD